MRKIIMTITLLMTALMLAACSKDKKSGTVRPGTGSGTVPGVTCNGCAQSNRLFTAMGRTGTGVDLIMEFFAGSTDQNGNPIAVNYTQGNYNGTVNGLGKLYIATSLSCGFGYTGALVPAGAYNVRVETMGLMDPTTQGISQMTVVAENGSYQVRMAIDNHIVFSAVNRQMRGCDGYDYGTEMVGMWRILSVNNVNICGNTIVFAHGRTQTQLMCP